MKEEYDFSKGERGKFYRPNAKLRLPVYLDDEILARLLERAEAKGVSLSEFVNEVLRRDIDLMEAVK